MNKTDCLKFVWKEQLLKTQEKGVFLHCYIQNDVFLKSKIQIWKFSL